MKRILAIALVVVLLFLMCSCASKGSVTLPDNIVKISVSWNGGPYNVFSYTDSDKINQLVSYFTSLELSKTKEDPMQYNGGGWIITVETSEETLNMHHYGNCFFKTTDGTWWEIPYQQAVELDAVLKQNYPDELPQNESADMWSK